LNISTKVPPVQLVRVIEGVRHQLLRLHQSLAPAPAVMVELITAAWLSQAITVAAELRIADALAEKPLAIDDLARKVDADADALSRLLRALIGRGIFRQRRDGRYDLTPLARTLRSGTPDSMAAFARFVGSPQDFLHAPRTLASSHNPQRSVFHYARGRPQEFRKEPVEPPRRRPQSGGVGQWTLLKDISRS